MILCCPSLSNLYQVFPFDPTALRATHNPGWKLLSDASLTQLTAVRAHKCVSLPFLITGPSKPLKETHSSFYIPLLFKDSLQIISHMELAKCWNVNTSQNHNSIDIISKIVIKKKNSIFYLNQLVHTCLYKGFWFRAETLTNWCFVDCQPSVDHSSSTLDLNLPSATRKPTLGSAMPDTVACIKQSGSCFLLTVTLRTTLRIWKGVDHDSKYFSLWLFDYFSCIYLSLQFCSNLSHTIKNPYKSHIHISQFPLSGPLLLIYWARSLEEIC